jgi:type I restriction enzyme S subunit
MFINNTPKEWEKGTVLDMLTLQRGHDLPKTLMNKGEYPVIGSTGIIGYHNQFTTKSPLIALGRSGNIGTPQYYKSDCWAHNTCLYVKEFRSVPLWAFFMLKHINYNSFVGGSAVPTLNRNFVHAQEITIPPIEVQDEFAQKISSSIEILDNNKQEIGKLCAFQEILLSRMAGSL